MARSSARGAPTSADVQVLGLTPHALWLMLGERELMLDFQRFPWFSRASLEDVCDVVLIHRHHLHWPRLDVDLHVDSIEHPERFPLVASSKADSKPHNRARKTRRPR